MEFHFAVFLPVCRPYRARPRRALLALGAALLLVLASACGSGAGGQGIPADTPPPIQTQPEAPRALSAIGLENLRAFTRLYGYVRFFHPSSEAAKAEWEGLAITGARQMESAATPEELAKRLQDFFTPLAPTLQVFPTSQSPALPSALLRPTGTAGLQVVQWNHLGVSTIPQARSTAGIYESSRQWADANAGLPPGVVDPADPYEPELGRGLKCRVANSLYGTNSITLPKASGTSAPFAGVRAPEDRGTRLGSLVVAWNVIQHFFPNFDDIPVDWDKALGVALSKAAQDANGEAFLHTLKQMMASLRDGHGFVYWTGSPAMALPGFQATWVSGQLVVGNVGASLQDRVFPGDIILAIDGVPAQEKVNSALPYLPSSTQQWLDFQSSYYILLGPPSSILALELRAPSGAQRSLTVPRDDSGPAYSEPRPVSKLAQLQPGVWYIDIDRVTRQDLDTAMPDLILARGLVVDMRGYPLDSRGWLLLFSHLSSGTLETPSFLTPTPLRPDRKNMTFQKDSWFIQPVAPKFTAKVAFLTDARAISQAELVMDFVDHYHLGEIVGSPTAGTDGEINPLRLPGGYSVYWTGMKVPKHNGTPLNGVGILPTVPVERTLPGIVAGRDEVLERALEIVNQ